MLEHRLRRRPVHRGAGRAGTDQPHRSPEVSAALNAVSGKLTTAGLIDLNRQLNSPEKPNVESVAKEWLASNDL